jgi:hypothetical protein
VLEVNVEKPLDALSRLGGNEHDGANDRNVSLSVVSRRRVINMRTMLHSTS